MLSYAIYWPNKKSYDAVLSCELTLTITSVFLLHITRYVSNRSSLEFNFTNHLKLGMVAHACDSSIWDYEFEADLGYTGRLWFTEDKNK